MLVELDVKEQAIICRCLMEVGVQMTKGMQQHLSAIMEKMPEGLSLIAANRNIM